MDRSGISNRIVKFANCLVGPIPGGLAIVSIVLTCFWGAISGSGPATVYALGSILIPAMIRSGYSPAFAAACMAASASISVIIPPSTTLIVYGVMAATSISDLYLAGILPGIMMGGLFCLWAFIVSKKRGYSAGKFGTAAEIWATFKESFFGILSPVFILGSIYAGIATPTESAVIGCLYSLIIGIFVYKGLNLRNLLGVFTQAAKDTSTLMLIIGCASCFSWLITSKGIAGVASAAIISVSGNTYILAFLCAVILLIAGCFLDSISIIYIFYPLLWPVISSLGYSSIWFGVVLSMAISVGMATPPVAVNIYPACNLAGIKMQDIIRDILGFVFMGFLSMIIVLFIPQIIDCLPALLAR